MSARDHDRLTTKFIKENLRPALRSKDGMAEVMVILESLTFGVMLLLQEVWGCTPQTAVGMCEACLDQAIKRLAKENERDQ